MFLSNITLSESLTYTFISAVGLFLTLLVTYLMSK